MMHKSIIYANSIGLLRPQKLLHTPIDNSNPIYLANFEIYIRSI